MLKKVQIRNFKSCKDVVLDNMGSVVALVGRNAAGKSNVLRAIDLIARAASATDESFMRFLFFNEKPLSLSAEIQLGRSLYCYSMRFVFKESPNHRGRVSVGLNESISVKYQDGDLSEVVSRSDTGVRTSFEGQFEIQLGSSLAPCLPALVALLPRTNGLVKILRPLLQFFNKVRYYPLDEPTDPSEWPSGYGYIHEEDYNKWLAKYKETGRPGTSVPMRILHMKLTGSESGRLRQVEEFLGDNGLKLIQRIRHTLKCFNGNGTTAG